MDIIKRLNLNKNPQHADNYSMCFAKNIKLSDDSTTIITDNGFKLSLSTGEVEGNIVGIIPCSTEIVIFTYNENNFSSHIYRGKEIINNQLEITEVITAWNYSGGKINGTYTYNVKGELIIAIAEYCNDKDVPLKTINLDKTDTDDLEEEYEVCPPIPITNMKYISLIKGKALPLGIYYFFCRFEIDTDYYTKWQPIGIPYYSVNLKNENIINVDINGKKSNSQISANYYFGLTTDNEEEAKIKYTLNVNDEQYDSEYNPKGIISINNTYKYKNIQIGYILQHDNSTVCRTWKKFKLNNDTTSITFIFDGKEIEEYSINDMLEPAFNIYNVKNICNYNNRLYIANYKETDYNSPKTNSTLLEYASRIRAKQIFKTVNDIVDYKDADRFNSDSFKYEYTLNAPGVGIFKFVTDVNTKNIQLRQIPGLIGAIANLKHSSDNSSWTVKKEVTDTIWENEINTSGYRVWFKAIRRAIEVSDGEFYDCGYDYLDYVQLNLYSEHLDDCAFSNGNDIVQTIRYYSGPTNAVIKDSREYGETEDIAFYYDADGVWNKILILINKNPYDENNPNHDRYQPGELNDYAYAYELDIARWRLSRRPIYNEQIDGSVRTLMPNDVYAFYVHYVRKDGTYTNGIPLENVGVTDKYSTLVVDKSTFAYSKLIERNSDVEHFEIGYYPVYENETEASFNYYRNTDGKLLFATSNGYRSIDDNGTEIMGDKLIIGVKFENIDIPEGYCGCFFSYEKPAELVKYHGLAIAKKADERNFIGIRIKATEVETGKQYYKGSVLMPYGFIDGDMAIHAKRYVKPMGYIAQSDIYQSDKLSKSVVEGFTGTYGCEGCITMHVINSEVTESDNGYFTVPETSCECYVKDVNRFIYTNKDKELIPFGGILSANAGDTNLVYTEETTNSDFNYPIFFTVDKFLIYRHKTKLDLTSDTSGKPTAIFDNGLTNLFIYFKPYTTIPKDMYDSIYALAANTETVAPGGNARFWFACCKVMNKYSKYNLNAISFKQKPEVAVSPLNVDIGSIMGNEHVTKTFSINTIVYPKDTSDLFQLQNTYIEKQYKAYINYNEYTTIDSNKTSTIRRSDVIADESSDNLWRNFRANNYKVIDKNKGDITNIIGIGLNLIVHTTQTLFIFDKTNIIKADNMNIGLQTPDTFDCEPIEQFTTQHGYGGLQTTDSWCVNHIGYFFIDKDNNKIFLFGDNSLKDLTGDIIKYINHFKIKDAKLVTDFKNNRVLMCITHDNNNITTLSYSYVTNTFLSIHDYKFEKGYSTKNRTYLLGNNKTNLFCIDENTFGDYKDLYYVNPNLPNYNNDNINTMVLDIIVNTVVETSSNNDEKPMLLNYEYAKTLNYLTYAINKIYSFSNDDYFDDENLHNEKLYDITHYAGDKIRIYTNLCDSGDIDIDVTEINDIEDYNKPYYNKGNWSFNYFRNLLNSPLEEKDILQHNGISDNKSLIYGKYFVIRFVFNITDNIPIRFEQLTVNAKRN